LSRSMEPTTSRVRVLFLCTGNSARSQMAEAYLRKYAGDFYDVYSAGLEPKGINPLTVLVLEEVGISMDGYTSKPLSQFLGGPHFGYMITLCGDAEERCPVFPGMGTRLHWPFDDPAAIAGTLEERLAGFRQVRGQIDTKILAWLREQDLL